MAVSNKVLALSEELTSLRLQQEENNAKMLEQHGKVEESEAMMDSSMFFKKEGTRSTKNKKKKGKKLFYEGKIVLEEEKVRLSQAISDKAHPIDMPIKAYNVEIVRYSMSSVSEVVFVRILSKGPSTSGFKT